VASGERNGVEITKRHHLRKDRVKEAEDALSAFGADLGGVMELAETGELELLLLDGEPVGFYLEGEVVPTVRGLLKWSPGEERCVTVDMGAVQFIYNGADVMVPGIVDADPEIEEGDLVYVDEEEHHKSLAVGRALIDGEEMAERTEGKAVESLHHVGDEVWEVGE